VSNRVYFARAATPFHARPFAGFKGTQSQPICLSRSLDARDVLWRIDQVTDQRCTRATCGIRTRHLAFPRGRLRAIRARRRGGVVVEVTNTKTAGPQFARCAHGKLRPAHGGNRRLGLITLESDLIISSGLLPHPCGQTAPGKGICTRKYQLGMSVDATSSSAMFVRDREIFPHTLNGLRHVRQ